MKMTKRPKNGIDVKLVGNQCMNVSGDKVRFEVGWNEHGTYQFGTRILDIG